MMERRRARASGAALLTLALACAAACGGPPPAKATFDFVLKDANGQDVNLADFKGKPLVVNFWATWCGPCKIETPYLEQFSQKYKAQGLTILGIETESDAAAIRKFASEYKVTYPLLVGLGQGGVQRAFGFRGAFPTSVFVRADGTIAAVVTGLRSEEYWERQILTLF